LIEEDHEFKVSLEEKLKTLFQKFKKKLLKRKIHT